MQAVLAPLLAVEVGSVAAPAAVDSDGSGWREPCGRIRRSLAHVMVYDLLLSRRRKIQGGGWAKRILLERKPALDQALERVMKAAGATSH